jgi:hypothetical protein
MRQLHKDKGMTPSTRAYILEGGDCDDLSGV